VRLVWWDAPTDWVRGASGGSGASSTDYCVAIRVSAALTTLANGSIYPLLDKPITDINLGIQSGTFDAVLTEIGGTWVDETTDAADVGAGDVGLALGANTDYLYLGAANPYNGLNLLTTLGATAALAATSALYYWNGLDWSSAATVVTDAWAGTMTDSTIAGNSPFGQDGAITFAGTPADWMPDVATNVDEIAAAISGATLTVVSADTTTPLYWIKIGTTIVVNNAATAAQLFALPSTRAFMEYNAAPSSSVEADEAIYVSVVDENVTVTLSILAVVSDI
jgi:hypothetical protein